MSAGFREKVEALVSNWEQAGLPGRSTLHDQADHLLNWRLEKNAAGLWDRPVRMLGATFDDAWGMGIELILKYAHAIGMETRFLGLLVSCRDIVAACKDFRPDFVGVTVLQFDTEDLLISLRGQLPASIRIIAGGPVFQYDPELQQRAGIDFVARDLTRFLKFMLDTASEQ